MKKLLFISGLLLAFACSKEDEQKDVDPIVGSWKWFHTTTSGDEWNGYKTYYQVTFFEDGTGYLGNLIEYSISRPQADRLEDCPTCNTIPIRWTRNEETKTQEMTYDFKNGCVFRDFSELSPSYDYFDCSDGGYVKMTFSEDYSTGSGIISPFSSWEYDLVKMD